MLALPIRGKKLVEGGGKDKGKSARKGGGWKWHRCLGGYPEGNPSWFGEGRTPKAAYFEGRMKKHCPFLSEKGWIEIGGEEKEAASSRALGPFYYS